MATMATAFCPAARVPRTRLWFSGAGNIFHKELLEWYRTRRFLVTAILGVVIMSVIPVGVWIVDYDASTNGRVLLTGSAAADARQSGVGTLLLLSSYLGIVLTMGMLIKERETGTAQWVFTKPVSRPGYGLAKWGANSVGVILASVVIPATVSFGLITALYRIPGWSWVNQTLATGLVSLHAAMVVALMLLLGTLFRSTVPVAVVALGLSVAPMFLGSLVGASALRLMPVFRLGDLVSAVADGRAVGATDLLPLLTGVVFLPLCLAVAGLRLTQEQLQ